MTVFCIFLPTIFISYILLYYKLTPILLYIIIYTYTSLIFSYFSLLFTDFVKLTHIYQRFINSFVPMHKNSYQENSFISNIKTIVAYGKLKETKTNNNTMYICHCLCTSRRHVHTEHTESHWFHHLCAVSSTITLLHYIWPSILHNKLCTCYQWLNNVMARLRPC